MVILHLVVSYRVATLYCINPGHEETMKSIELGLDHDLQMVTLVCPEKHPEACPSNYLMPVYGRFLTVIGQVMSIPSTAV